MTTQPRAQPRQWVRDNFRRYFTVIYTPFLPNGDIDEEGLRHNVRTTMALPGVGGLSVNSIHQEFWTLTDAERRRVTEIVLDTVQGKLPTIVGVSDTSVRNVISLAQHAAACGADALMVWPPYYGPKDSAGIQDFYEAIAARTDAPFFVYSTTLTELGFYLTPAMVSALLPIGNLVGVQNTTLNFSAYAAMMEAVGSSICVSTSLEEYFLFGKLVFPACAPDFLMGSSRPLLVQNADHPRCEQFIARALAGDFQGAASIMRDIIAIADKLQSRFFAQGHHAIALSKALSTHLGLKDGGVRPPAGPAAPDALNECRQVMRAAGLLSSAVSTER
jgi:4-hydroxy-tetrahydrodipicolinate synthase